MARKVHALGEDGYTGCCGKPIAALGMGASFAMEPEEVTCEPWATMFAKSQAPHDHTAEGDCTTSCPRHGEPYRVAEETEPVVDLQARVLEDIGALLVERATLLGRITALEAEIAVLRRQS